MRLCPRHPTSPICSAIARTDRVGKGGSKIVPNTATLRPPLPTLRRHFHPLFGRRCTPVYRAAPYRDDLRHDVRQTSLKAVQQREIVEAGILEYGERRGRGGRKAFHQQDAAQQGDLPPPPPPGLEN